MKANDSISPWSRPAPPGYPIPNVTVCDAESRLDAVHKSYDRSWLNRVVRDADTQISVRRAAERRLRKIATAPLAA